MPERQKEKREGEKHNEQGTTIKVRLMPLDQPTMVGVNLRHSIPLMTKEQKDRTTTKKDQNRVVVKGAGMDKKQEEAMTGTTRTQEQRMTEAGMTFLIHLVLCSMHVGKFCRGNITPGRPRATNPFHRIGGKENTSPNPALSDVRGATKNQEQRMKEAGMTFLIQAVLCSTHVGGFCTGNLMAKRVSETATNQRTGKKWKDLERMKQK